MGCIYQFLAGYSNGDAISNEARLLRDLFRSWGYRSEICVEPGRTLPELQREVLDPSLVAAEAGPNDLVVLHLSIGALVNDLFQRLKCRRAMIYHNISPPEHFKPFNPRTAALLERGRAQAAALSGSADVALAVSEFNARELAEMGYRNPRVFPLVLDFAGMTRRSNRARLRRYRDGRVNVLFVGRCVPNKRIEDLLTAFYYFQRHVEPNSRLIHVGSFAGTERYHALLRTLQRDLELRQVEWLGSVPAPDWAACYQAADIFVSMSEHEGFCIPLLESMMFEVPVLAYAAGAVPETLDGAGVLFREKRYDAVAEMMGRLIRDDALRGAVLRGQSARLDRYRARDLDRELRDHLAPLLPPA